MKRLSAFLLTLCVLFSVPLSAAAEEVPAGPEIPAPSAILIDAGTGTVLYEKNADELLPPASVTKVMTLLLVMEALDAGSITLETPVTASETAAAKGGSQVFLEPGETMTVDEMLKSVAVSSANDCATALAELLAGSEDAFVERMNARAADLGMTNTHFVNCTGLDDDPDAAEHLTTARDIARMSRELLSHERIKTYTTIWMDTVRGGAFGLSNTNKLIRFYDGATGLKTGFTSTAGHCLSASAKRQGMELIAVVLHCDSSSDRFQAARTLLDYGFATWAACDPLQGVTLPPVGVDLGETATVLPVLSDPTPLLVAKGTQVERTVELPETVPAPVEAGQELGVLRLAAGGRTLKEIPLVAAAAVPRRTWASLFLELLRKTAMGE